MAQYDHIWASGNTRQHNGNVYNDQAYNYNIRERCSDETLRENAHNKQLCLAAFEGQTKRVEHLDQSWSRS